MIRRFLLFVAPVLALSACDDPIGPVGETGTIVFARAGEIWVIEDGDDPALLVSRGEDPTDPYRPWFEAPALSRDGLRLAYISSLPNAPLYYPLDMLVIQNLGGDGARYGTMTGYNHSQPAWSPDGSYVAFSAYHDDWPDPSASIDLAPTDGREAFRVIGGAPDSFSRDPAWSPDGEHLAFILDGTLRISTPSGEDAREIPTPGLVPAAPDWGPQGEWIAFSATAEGGDGSHIYVARQDGTDLRRLDGTTRGLNPSWSPSGRRIIFAIGHPDRSIPAELAVVTVDGGGVEPLGFEGAAPDWVP